MKTRALLLTMLLIFTISSCSKSPYSKFEDSLTKQATERSKGMIKDFKIDSISIDTFTVAESMANFEEKMKFMDNLSKEDFIILRNQEFDDFRAPGYYESIMTGDLKDASEWCTLLRVNTEKADSLISNWDNLPKYNYELAFLTAWYLDRKMDFLGDHSWEMRKSIENSKDGFEKYHRYKDSPADSIIAYIVYYESSFFNPILKTKVKDKSMAMFNSEYELMENETLSTKIE